MRKGFPHIVGTPKSLVEQPEESIFYRLSNTLGRCCGLCRLETGSRSQTVVLRRRDHGTGASPKLHQQQQGSLLKGVEVIYLDFPFVPLTPGQANMSKGIATIWFEIQSFVRQFAIVKTGRENVTTSQ